VDKLLALNMFICSTGLLLHFAMKWGEARRLVPNKEAKPGLADYIKEVPAQSLISVVATVAAFTVTHAMEWMNPGMALACGYMGNSMAENLANRFVGGK
jgi:hypothetical protein